LYVLSITVIIIRPFSYLQYINEIIDFSPYMLSLGLTKSTLSLIWNVGPITGMICQPVVGVISDRTMSRWGMLKVLGMLPLGCMLRAGSLQDVDGR
jgi:hypothetical protein